MTRDEALTLLQAQVSIIVRNAWLSTRPGACTELEDVARNIGKAVAAIKSETE